VVTVERLVTGMGRAAPAVAIFLVGVIAMIAVRSAMLPGVAFWDTAELQAVGPLMGTGHPAGFPTYVLLGWFASVVLQPFGEPAFRMNLLAGVCLAVACGITVDLVRALTQSTVLGIAAGIGLAFTPIAWSIGTHAETHALHLVFVALLFRLLVAWEGRAQAGGGEGHAPGGQTQPGPSGDRYLVAGAVVFGLSVGNHSLTLLLVLPVVLFVRAVVPDIWSHRRLVRLCVAAFVGSVVLVYLELPLRAGPFRAELVYGRPETWDGFWYVVLGEQFRASVVDPFGDLPTKFAALVDRTVDQFGPLAPVLPIAFGTTIVRRPSYALLTGSAVAITCFFAASYQNAEIGRYYLGPTLMAWTWLGILAGMVAETARRLIARAQDTLETRGTLQTRGASSGSGPPPLIAALVLLVVLAPTAISLPERHARVDMSRDDGAQRWLDHALGEMGPGAVVVSWWSYSTPLWYAQRVDGRRPDVVIIDDRTRLDEGLGDITDVIDAHLGRQPVFVIRDDPAEIVMLAERYVLEPIDGVDARSLTRVVARRGAGS
jgi:hypothetical protein